MKHCCTPKTTVSSMVSRKTLVLGYHLHRETQYFHLHRETIFPLRDYQRPCFRASPQSPQTAHEGGESPTPFPNLSLRVLKCPFRALSPCPIQILAGALSYYLNERSYEKHIGYAEHPMSEFLRPYAEKIRTPIRYLRIYAHDRFWNFCG